jgi:hypothetical protein
VTDFDPKNMDIFEKLFFVWNPIEKSIFFKPELVGNKSVQPLPKSWNILDKILQLFSTVFGIEKKYFTHPYGNKIKQLFVDNPFNLNAFALGVRMYLFLIPACLKVDGKLDSPGAATVPRGGAVWSAWEEKLFESAHPSAGKHKNSVSIRQ